MSSLNKGISLQNGKYIIGSTLGQGGFGITYEAEQVSLGRRVAVKEFFMKDSCERDENTSRVTVPTDSNRNLVSKFMDKFVREARMIAALDHEHIVKIFDVFEENGTAYYVMEYLGGGSLDRKIRNKGAMSETEALDIIHQITDALSYLHSQNILHFDIKPSNILFGKNGSAKLIDFGLSKHYDETGNQTSSTPVGFSKGYAPLEQYQQGSDIRSFTPATDIYALGATLYAMLAGTTPPEASIVNEDGVPVISGISSNVMRAIETAMSPRRKDRPQSIEKFLSILNGTTKEDSEETIIRKKSKLSPKPSTKHSSKWIIGILIGVIVSVAAVLLWPSPIKSTSPSAAPQTAQTAPEPTETHIIHEWVDLGLSVKWATCNVGATKSEEYGGYFAWGETSQKNNYNWNTLKYRTEGDGYEDIKFSKYVEKSKYGPVDNKTCLDVSDDVARKRWGGNWRMPTVDEFKELIDKCNWTWTTMNGVHGYKVTSNMNGNFIFLPAAGWRLGASLINDGSYGDYWSSSLNENSSYLARGLEFYSDYHNTNGSYRCRGRSVRPVCP